MEYEIGQLVVCEGSLGWIVDKKNALPGSQVVRGIQYKIEWSDDRYTEGFWYSKESVSEFIEELEDLEKK